MSSAGADDPLARLISQLTDAGVEFIVVGGAAAVLQDAPIVTEDVEIVRRRTQENITRLTGVLGQLDACSRGDPARRELRPRASDFAGHGHLLLMAISCFRRTWASSTCAAKALDSAARRS